MAQHKEIQFSIQKNLVNYHGVFPVHAGENTLDLHLPYSLHYNRNALAVQND